MTRYTTPANLLSIQNSFKNPRTNGLTPECALDLVEEIQNLRKQLTALAATSPLVTKEELDHLEEHARGEPGELKEFVLGPIQNLIAEIKRLHAQTQRQSPTVINSIRINHHHHTSHLIKVNHVQYAAPSHLDRGRLLEHIAYLENNRGQ